MRDSLRPKHFEEDDQDQELNMDEVDADAFEFPKDHPDSGNDVARLTSDNNQNLLSTAELIGQVTGPAPSSAAAAAAGQNDQDKLIDTK